MNGTMMQYFHWYLPDDGKLWKQLQEDAPRLKSMGFSAVWLPPPFKTFKGSSGPGYAVYDLYDLGEFDQKGSIRTKYGTRQEYVDAVASVRAAGMQAIVDIVLNHKAGGDETEKIKVVKVNPENRNEVISEPFDAEAYTKFTFPGRKKKYSDFVWNHTCFTGVDRLANTDDSGIYKIISEYGSDWQEMIHEENGNYDYLMFNDINFKNKQVTDELDRWGGWFYKQAPFDGVRLDAVKHIPAWFYDNWIDHLQESVGRELFAVAEFWSPGRPDLLLKYLEATHEKMSLFDAPLQKKFHDAACSGKDFNMATIFENTLVAQAPAKAVTLVSNHDTQPCQALESPVEGWFKPIAYALILLRQDGYPCVFYPDLYGAQYEDKNHEGEMCNIHLEKVAHIDHLLRARCDHAYGIQRDYFDHPNCVGWTREGDQEHSGCAVLISNGERGNKFMEVGKRYAGRYFVDMLQNIHEEIWVNDDGWGEFFAPPGSLAVWVEKIDGDK